MYGNIDQLNDEQKLELIKRRRNQILVHSCIYYKFDMNIIEDNNFDKFCHELLYLQEKYPRLCEQVEWHKEFKNMTHASGFDLPYNDPYVQGVAISLLRARGMM